MRRVQVVRVTPCEPKLCVSLFAQPGTNPFVPQAFTQER